MSSTPTTFLIWYCVDDGYCVATKANETPYCDGKVGCNFECIYEIDSNGSRTRKGDNAHMNIEKYFEYMNDGYKKEYLENVIITFEIVEY